MNNHINKFKTLFFVLIIPGIISINGCKKFIEVNAPITNVNQNNVYSNNTNAIASITGIYTKMSSSDLTLNLSVLPELSGDNLDLYDLNNMNALVYYQNILDARYQNQQSILWNDLYSYIYACNAAIEGISSSSGITAQIKQRLLGESFFLRGFFYYYLVNLYQNVPLVLTTDYSITSKLPNVAAEEVYKQIVLDLLQSQQLLDNNYVNGSLLSNTTERVRPNGMTVIALLARVYLSMKNYSKAEEEASKVIAASNIYSLSQLNEVFLKNSSETIWALQPVSYDNNTKEGDFYIYSVEGPNTINYTYLSNDLINQFELGDARLIEWVSLFRNNGVNYNYAHKYKVKNGDPATASEYPIVLRLSEQYLIRSEARIKLGKIDEGINDMNTIRRRARAVASPEIPNPLPDIKYGISEEKAIEVLIKEKRVELFTEWGHRWFDIKRTGKVDLIMEKAAPLKGGQWKSYQSLYPIPSLEISRNNNLKQNPGYN